MLPGLAQALGLLSFLCLLLRNTKVIQYRGCSEPTVFPSVDNNIQPI